MKTEMIKRCQPVALTLLLMLGGPSAHAAVVSWTGAGVATSGNWSNTNNWQGNAVPVDGDSLSFYGGTPSSRTPGFNTNLNNLSPAPLITGISLSGHNFNIGGTSTRGTIRLSGPITRNDEGNTGFNSNIELLANTVITVEGSTRSITMSGNTISGNFGITKEGVGTLIMTGGSKTFTGGIVVNAGGLRAEGTTGKQFGEGALTIHSGVVTLAGATGVTVNGLRGNGGEITAEGGARTLTVHEDSATPASYAGVLKNGAGADVLSLTKTGTGSLTLTGNSTYTGATAVSAGLLNIEGQLGATAVTIASGAGLGGDGGSIGGGVSVSSGGYMTFSLGVPDETYLSVAGNLSLVGTTDLKLTLNYAAQVGDEFELVNVAGTRSGTFSTINGASFGEDNAFDLNYGGRDYSLQLSYLDGVILARVTAVPEPSVAGLLILTGMGWLMVRKRRA